MSIIIILFILGLGLVAAIDNLDEECQNLIERFPGNPSFLPRNCANIPQNHCFQQKQELIDAINFYVEYTEFALWHLGSMEDWCIQINDLSWVFLDQKDTDFNVPLNKWDLSNATNLKGMFYHLR